MCRLFPCIPFFFWGGERGLLPYFYVFLWLGRAYAKKGSWVAAKHTTKMRRQLLDVTMGSFDGAEICKLVGLYLLDKLSSVIGRQNVGLYKDNGFAAIKSSSGSALDQMRQNIVALFKNKKLSIVIETNLFEMDFLNVTFNLVIGKFFLFRKPNNQLLYIIVEPNLPPSMIRDIPNMIRKRLSDLSWNEKGYEKKAKPFCGTALIGSGYKTSLAYTRSNRNRASIIWFNPPYSQNVKTNIGKTFLKLTKKIY